jgi:flagellar motility protein MotE (MotC chaperone)
MKRKSRFAFGFFLILVILAMLSLKLLMATGNLMIQCKGLSSLFSTPEVLATDQKKNVAKPSDKDATPKFGQDAALPADQKKSGLNQNDPGPTTKPTADVDPVRTAKSSNSSSAEMLSHLEQRESALKRKEQNLQEQEERLLQMQKEMEQKLQELIVVQKEIQSFRTEKAETKNASIRSLAQIYGTMKPKEAAKLLENMDEKLAVNVLSTMKPNEAADVLAIMDVKKAAKISEALTQR